MSIPQATFSVLDHRSGRAGSSAATPLPAPRNPGQPCAWVLVAPTVASIKRIASARCIRLPNVTPKRVSRGSEEPQRVRNECTFALHTIMGQRGESQRLIEVRAEQVA